MSDNSIDTALYFLVGVVVAFCLFMFLANMVRFFDNFSRELKQINSEINRSTGRERRRWIRRKRKLWLSLIPFVRY